MKTKIFINNKELPYDSMVYEYIYGDRCIMIKTEKEKLSQTFGRTCRTIVTGTGSGEQSKVLSATTVLEYPYLGVRLINDNGTVRMEKMLNKDKMIDQYSFRVPNINKYNSHPEWCKEESLKDISTISIDKFNWIMHFGSFKLNYLNFESTVNYYNSLMKKEYERVIAKRVDKKDRTSLRHSRHITISGVSDKLIKYINGQAYNIKPDKIIVFKALMQMANIKEIPSNYYPDGVIMMKDLEKLFIFLSNTMFPSKFSVIKDGKRTEYNVTYHNNLKFKEGN